MHAAHAVEPPTAIAVSDAVAVAQIIPSPVASASAVAIETSAQKQKKLEKYGFPAGLREQFIKTLNQIPLRIWVLDNSGSMSTHDGNFFIAKTKRMASCTRWDELQNTMKLHLSLASDLQAPCVLRLLNPGHDGSQVMTCSDPNPEVFGAQIHAARATIMRTYPGNSTPLAWHVHQVHDRIRGMVPELRSRGQKVCVVLATDGLPTDNPRHVHGGAKEAFRQALNSLSGLPVWVVIRLLTDNEDVVDYYNDLDQQVEVPLDVLDDWEGEAREVCAVNPWINYTQELHHAREFGLLHPVFDLMDEKAFGASEVMQFLGLIFGEDAVLEMPTPLIDMDGFLEGVQRLLNQTAPSFNILRKKIKPVVSLKKLEKHLKRQMNGPKGECVIL